MVEAAMVVVAERERGRKEGWRRHRRRVERNSHEGKRMRERENREEWRMREIRTGVLHEGDKTGVGGAAPRATRF
jgi:hypothetical protein